MRFIKSLAIFGAFCFTVPNLSLAYPCSKSPKTEAELASKIKKSGAKNENEFLDFLRNKSMKEGIHKSILDEDIKNAFSLAKVESKPATSEKTKAYKSSKKQTRGKGSKPTKPAEPATPAQPAIPAKPAQPANPAQQATQALPATPAKPATTAMPAEQAKPSRPAQPATPAQPAVPAQPATPAEKSKSAPIKKKVEGC